ncbi:acyltransferase family protein [Maribacter stanieri]|uniref:Surface polysaccharide O-acyltransferase, integral membrane enzyme n=1 Tax=Maribacter stanieri TaxID=440514 RepID=A0A1I6I6C8_9FLAO|nr:acyltransferase family protein [Maribacter stanieri]SFR62209.1 Surface polysaccharide O-acyltransferase, integral membrane enzyme [Maribacter stanieri]
MSRNINADTLKCMSIIGVVYIHSYPILGQEDSLIFLSDIFRFAVPCFIILWAYFLEKSISKKVPKQRIKYLTKRFLHLFRVFMIWSVLYFFLFVDWGSLNIKTFFSKYFSGYGWAGQYFFILLFQLIPIYPILRKMYNSKFLQVVIVLISISIYIVFEYYFNIVPEFLKKLGYRPFYFWVPYVFLGIALARNKIKSFSKIFIISPLLIGLEIYILRKNHIAHFDYITLGTLLFSILFCITFLKSANFNLSEKFHTLIDFIAKNTLVIFVSNPLLIIVLKELIDYSNITTGIILLPAWLRICLSLLTVMIVFSGTLIITNFLHKTKLIKFLG